MSAFKTWLHIAQHSKAQRPAPPSQKMVQQALAGSTILEVVGICCHMLTVNYHTKRSSNLLANSILHQ